MSSLYANDLLKYKTGVRKKHASREALNLQRKMLFIKKSFIYKEKSGTVTKIKFKKFRKRSQLYFGILVFALYCY